VNASIQPLVVTSRTFWDEPRRQRLEESTDAHF